MDLHFFEQDSEVPRLSLVPVTTLVVNQFYIRYPFHYFLEKTCP
jgi:hypothetical protein